MLSLKGFEELKCLECSTMFSTNVCYEKLDRWKVFIEANYWKNLKEKLKENHNLNKPVLLAIRSPHTSMESEMNRNETVQKSDLRTTQKECRVVSGYWTLQLLNWSQR